MIGLIWVLLAKGIDKAGIDKTLKTSSLFLGETVLSLVGLWPCQVDGHVRHIKIATEDHRLLCFEGFEIAQQTAVPILSVVEPAQIAFGIGHVDADYKQLVELGRGHSAFLIMAFDAHARLHRDGRDF